MKTSSVNITFLGAAGEVTGSKFFLKTPDVNLMIDSGVFQGLKELRLLNWNPLPIDVSSIEFVLLTHGHLDHVGYLPRLVKQGFKGNVLGTPPTLAVAEIILKDSAKIHEEEAEKANEEGFTLHQPALPFFNLTEAESTIRRFKSVNEGEWISLSDTVSARFQYNGHIIGATFIELDISGKRFVFSGDVGRPNDLLLRDPKHPKWADYLFIESTYGDRLHDKEDVEAKFIDLINQTIKDNGLLIIPSFAVERIQYISFLLWQLYKKRKIPNIPIYVDSPMGNNVFDVFQQFPDWHKMDMHEYYAMCNHLNMVQSYAETWETIDNPGSKIVIAGSGMVTGGRVLTYLQQFIDKPTTRVLLVGFQAEGTRGRALKEGTHEIKFFGKYYPVKAKIHSLESLSAHADQQELLHWLNDIKNVPEEVFLVHGEPNAQQAFCVKLNDTFQWKVKTPKLYETVRLIW